MSQNINEIGDVAWLNRAENDTVEKSQNQVFYLFTFLLVQICSQTTEPWILYSSGDKHRMW